MIDENATVPDSPAALLYDWFKHLTTLSLVTLGGVLGLVQGKDGNEIKPAVLFTVLVFVATSGLLAFSGAGQVVRAQTTGAALPDYVHKMQAIASVLLSMGVGAFLYAFVEMTI